MTCDMKNPIYHGIPMPNKILRFLFHWSSHMCHVYIVSINKSGAYEVVGKIVWEIHKLQLL